MTGGESYGVIHGELSDGSVVVITLVIGVIVMHYSEAVVKVVVIVIVPFIILMV